MNKEQYNKAKELQGRIDKLQERKSALLKALEGSDFRIEFTTKNGSIQNKRVLYFTDNDFIIKGIESELLEVNIEIRTLEKQFEEL